MFQDGGKFGPVLIGGGSSKNPNLEGVVGPDVRNQRLKPGVFL